MGSDPRQGRVVPLSRPWHQADQSHTHTTSFFPDTLACPCPPVCPTPTPRDVSSVELLMKYHQGIRAEIETRSKNFNACLELGESLLQREHQASEEVRGQWDTASFSVLALPLLLDQKLPGEAHLPFLLGALVMGAAPNPFRGLAAW